MSEDKNIFESASKKMGKKSKKNVKKIEEPHRSPVADQNPPLKELPSTRNKDPEIKEMMGQIHSMKKDLQNKLDNLYTQSGMSPEALKKFLDNPKNFSQKDWDFMQQNKHVLEKNIWDVLGEELKPILKYERENMEGERKGKTLGARKKWIPIH